ncbi:amidohydrolase family protein [Acidobacteriota bacterium]
MLKRCLIFFCVLVVTVFYLGRCASNGPDDFDILLKNGLIVDGSGNPGIKADLGITGDTIVEIGDLKKKSGVTTIDAEGLVISPGFIDLHTHCDRGLGSVDSNANLNYLIQGVTTVVTGMCGGSVSLKVAEIKNEWEEQGLGTNAVYLVGHGSIRRSVMGVEPREATPEEIEKMKEILRQAMTEGAWGISTGLEYIPGRYANTEEVIAVTKIVGEFGGIYTSHMRNENEGIAEAINETIRIGEETGASVNVAHIKVTGRDNWGLMKDAVKLISDARARGVSIAADQYPYLYGGPIGLLWSFPQIPENMEPLAEVRKKSRNRDLSDEESMELRNLYVDELKKALADKPKRDQIKKMTVEGLPHDPSPVAMWGWHDFTILVADKNSHLMGRNFTDLAAEQEKDLFDIIADLVIDEPDILYGSGSQSQEDHDLALKQDWLMVSSDGGASAILKPEDKPRLGHPRPFGSQTRVLRKYVREEKILALEEAVRKMSSLPASFLQMKDRGLLKKGYKADIVVFNPDTVRDNATYSDSRKYATGVDYVIVGGKISVDKGQYEGALNGQVLLLTENK